MKKAGQRVDFWCLRTTRQIIQAVMTRPRLQRARGSFLSSQTSSLNQNMTGFRLKMRVGQIFCRGYGGSSPPGKIISKSKIIHVKFHTDDSRQRSGWRMDWTEVWTQGSKLLSNIDVCCCLTLMNVADPSEQNISLERLKILVFFGTKKYEKSKSITIKNRFMFFVKYVVSEWQGLVCIPEQENKTKKFKDIVPISCS